MSRFVFVRPTDKNFLSGQLIRVHIHIPVDFQEIEAAFNVLGGRKSKCLA